MRPVKVKDQNADFAKPKDWNEETMGTCGSLPIRRVVSGAGGPNPFVSHFSNWKPYPDELARLNAGGVVELECCGLQPAVSVAVVPCADPDAGSQPRSMEAIRGAVARGWCHDGNTEKEMDSTLAEAIAQEVATMFGVDAS